LVETLTHSGFQRVNRFRGRRVANAMPKRNESGFRPATPAKEPVNELQASIFPSLHHRKEGWLRGQIRSREASLFRADGVVFLFVLNRKTTPASRSADASRNLFNRSATPPCGDARRGMTRDSTFVHTF